MFRIRIWLDPYHLAGSGSRSTSGNVDLDPSSKNKSWLTNTKIHQNYKNIIFLLRNHLFCWIYVNNQVINYKKKKTSLWVLYIYRKKSKNKIGVCDPPPDPDPLCRKRIRGSGSASKWSGSETLKNWQVIADSMLKFPIKSI